MSRNPNKAPRRHTGLIIFLILIMLILIAGSAFMIKLSIDLADKEAVKNPMAGITLLPSATDAEPQPTETEPPETTVPVPEHEVSTATIVSTGDLLMHKPVIDTCWTAGSYDFESVFRYITEDVSAADYAVANLETTFAGTDNGYSYSGYPNFNCPDALADGAKAAGFDMLLNANNHSYDTSSVGLHRTISILKDRGLDYTGIADTEDEKRYVVKEINGINIGMICYTYETDTSADRVALNGLPVKAEDAPLVNAFDYNALDSFYSELAGHLEAMEKDGAEASVLYIHWGYEYQLVAHDIQKKMAQGICDLGVDVIVGGHPHVVQPMELLTSTTDEDHKTVCLYSMGNAVSNQRQGNLTAIATAHTEDGVLFSITFSKYSDGTVYLKETDVLPLWVYRRADGTGNEYNILPLHTEKSDEWASTFNVQDFTVNSALRSYDRTMAIVGEGLKACQNYLEQSYNDREQYYYDLAFNPDKVAADPVKITKQPESVSAADGEKASVTVTAKGDDLTYAWYFANAGTEEFKHTDSFTDDTYSIKMNAERNGRQVYCVITDRYGNTVQSDTVTFSMN